MPNIDKYKEHLIARRDDSRTRRIKSKLYDTPAHKLYRSPLVNKSKKIYLDRNRETNMSSVTPSYSAIKGEIIMEEEPITQEVFSAFGTATPKFTRTL